LDLETISEALLELKKEGPFSGGALHVIEQEIRGSSVLSARDRIFLLRALSSQDDPQQLVKLVEEVLRKYDDFTVVYVRKHFDVS